MIETPNLHKATPDGGVGPHGGQRCQGCGQSIKHLPAGQGWVHDDGHVLGYNPTPESELETVTRLLIDAARAWHRNPSSARHVLALSQTVSRYEEVIAREVEA